MKVEIVNIPELIEALSKVCVNFPFPYSEEYCYKIKEQLQEGEPDSIIRIYVASICCVFLLHGISKKLYQYKFLTINNLKNENYY